MRIVLVLVLANCAAAADDATSSSGQGGAGAGGAASCLPGAEEPCYGGAPEKAGVGICARGLRHCQLDSSTPTWGECTGWVAPGVERCDVRGLDEDCDGSVDESCSCGEGETGRA